MTHPNHRGPHPEDARLFAPAEVAKLRVAAEEAAYLLSRGYAQRSVLDVVGRKHQLEARQRRALGRCMCSEQQWRAREAHRVEVASIEGRVLVIDGFNLIIGLEVALSGGLMLRGSDGALRDLAGLRGSYHTVEETERALELFAGILTEFEPAVAFFFLDAPVSNSGKLRTRILEHAAHWSRAATVQLVPNADRELAGRELVVSGDSAVIDAAGTWVNLLDFVVRARVPEAWVIDLGARG